EFEEYLRASNSSINASKEEPPAEEDPNKSAFDEFEEYLKTKSVSPKDKTSVVATKSQILHSTESSSKSLLNRKCDKGAKVEIIVLEEPLSNSSENRELFDICEKTESESCISENKKCDTTAH